MALEKMRFGKNIEMNVQIKGDVTKDKIAPLLLLRFIENSFQQSNSDKIAQAWINLEILVEDHVMEMKLMNGKTTESPAKDNGEETSLAMTEKRLQLIYPEKYELRINEEPEIMIINLRLQLTTMVTEKRETLQKSITGSEQLTKAFS
jgi:LytS/YehU family sensor histidine kinase